MEGPSDQITTDTITRDIGRMSLGKAADRCRYKDAEACLRRCLNLLMPSSLRDCIPTYWQTVCTRDEITGVIVDLSWCLVMVERLFLAVPWGCLRFVIVVFPDHTHLLFMKVLEHVVEGLIKHSRD